MCEFLNLFQSCAEVTADHVSDAVNLETRKREWILSNNCLITVNEPKMVISLTRISPFVTRAMTAPSSEIHVTGGGNYLE